MSESLKLPVGAPTKRKGLRNLTCAALIVLGVSCAVAGPREQARRIHDRIAGVPPSHAVLDAMEADIAAGNDLQAAFTAMENSAFYNVTLKNLAAPWTNEAQSVFVPLNDYTATVIGMVRDDVPFTELLSADLVYVGDPALGLPPYSMTNNDHYEALEAQGIDLKQHLVAVTQSSVTDLPAEATAGIMTSRAAAKAFFAAGTNRAMYRFTMLNHLCADLAEIKDNTLPPDRVRQDVSRSPGGDSRIFLNNCVGCHTGMEPLTQAYAYYDFDEALGRLVYNRKGTVDPETGTRVQKKYLINANTFKYGYVTRDDRWDNYWRQGRNAALGWDPGLPGSGHGAKSMGRELAHSEAFARCQVKKVFKAVCLRAPGDAADRAQVDAMVASFKNHNYSLKQVFAESAVYCKGD